MKVGEVGDIIYWNGQDDLWLIIKSYTYSFNHFDFESIKDSSILKEWPLDSRTKKAKFLKSLKNNHPHTNIFK